MPNPRKLSPAMSPIEYVRRRLASTSSGLVMLGRISPKRIFVRDSPSTSAACTKSRSTISSDAPRVTRATRGIVVTPTTSTSSQSFAPIVETTTSARTIEGKARITSIARMSTSSRNERAYAATRPIDTPSTRPRAVASSESPRIERPPQRNRLRTSRPRLSAPSRTAWEGCAYGTAANSVGECGAKNGPTSATPTSSATSRRPIFVRA